MPAPSSPLFSVVAHADWSVDPRKRWAAMAVTDQQGHYHVASLGPLGEVSTYFARLRDLGGPTASVLAGFDFPIGVPAHYADLVGISDFPNFLSSLGQDGWTDFYEPAERAEEISPYRPFYPSNGGQKGERSHAQLTTALAASEMNDLRRACELKTAVRNAACPLFWTLGGNQVGKAAISGWRDLLRPSLHHAAVDVRLWPFDGDLFALMAPGRVLVAETYPAEIYHHLGIDLNTAGTERKGKRSQAARKANAPRIVTWLAQQGITLADDVRAAVQSGFGAASTGEDAFDAFIGLLGMLETLQAAQEPYAGPARAIEGWILGQVEPAANRDPEQSYRPVSSQTASR